jgi:phosphoribosylformylglycinamidine (FGAM) synthase PurS component
MYPVAVVLQYTIQYNTQKTQNNTYTLETIHNTKITNPITQNYKFSVQKETRV